MKKVSKVRKVIVTTAVTAALAASLTLTGCGPIVSGYDMGYGYGSGAGLDLPIVGYVQIPLLDDEFPFIDLPAITIPVIGITLFDDPEDYYYNYDYDYGYDSSSYDGPSNFDEAMEALGYN